ncbi:MAG: cyclic nucleotide-binding/CBS domain-containing protein [Desulfosalsimonas sp.]
MAMRTAADVLREKRTSRLVTVPYDTVIIDAVRVMTEEGIGAVLIGSQGRIDGIWTERDFLKNMLEPGFDPKTSKVGDHMQTSLVEAGSDTPVYRLEEMFLGLFIRHILIKDKETYLGLLSIGDVLRSSLLEKDKEIKELNRIASWEYYENWAWHHRYEPRTGSGSEEDQ